MLRGNLRFRKIPIIAISSLERMEQLETAVKLGADAWMIKPFCAVQFLNIARDFNLDVEFENPISIEPPLLAVA
jgi:CheY-like chemotaxis protein